jgi:hypothetical protein
MGTEYPTECEGEENIKYYILFKIKGLKRQKKKGVETIDC